MRAALADAEPAVRSALSVLMQQGLGMQVVGEAETAEELQDLVQTHRPDLVVVAWNLVAAEPAQALRALHRLRPGLRIVALGLRAETRRVALEAGADGFISKVDAPREVIAVLRAVASYRPSTEARASHRAARGDKREGVS